jgi:hypothetical protein
MRSPASLASGLALATIWRVACQPGLGVQPEAPSGMATDVPGARALADDAVPGDVAAAGAGVEQPDSP